MRNIYFWVLCLIVVAGCRSKAGLNQQKGPFTGSSYHSNKKCFRVGTHAESMSLDTARNLATLDAKEQLLGLVRTETGIVYSKYTGVNTIQGSRFKEVTMDGLNHTFLSGVKQIAERVYEPQNKSYQVWVVMELRKREFYHKLKQHIMDDAAFSDAEKNQLNEMINKTITELDDK